MSRCCWSRSLGEETTSSIEKALRKDFPYLSQQALHEIHQQCRQTIFSEQVREFMEKRLRHKFPALKQQALEEIAQQCKQVVSDRLMTEAPIMAASQARINLLTLPNEIRNRIAELVVVAGRHYGYKGPQKESLIQIRDYFAPSDSNFDPEVDAMHHHRGDDEWAVQPAFTRVCRQLREETLPVYYGQNTFLFDVWDHGYHDAAKTQITLSSSGTKDWLSMIGAKTRALIKSAIVENGPCNRTKTSAERFATALNEAGIGLRDGVIRSYKRDFKIWNEITQDSIKKEATVQWVLDAEERFWG